MPDPDVEVPLPGGDVTVGVVRVGQTVRRPTGPHSPLVHAVLTHLERVGFDGAPRLHGTDEQGREVLDFVDGEVAGRPWPDWVADEERIASVARLVRRYDDAVAPLGLPPESVQPADPPGTPPPAPYPAELVGHQDVTPENVVFRDGRAHALIDFDLARPATRADEMFNVMLWWAPLTPPADRAEPLREVDAVRRCVVLADAYDLAPRDRARLVEVAQARTARSWHLMRHHARTRGGGWQRMWDDGLGEAIRRRGAWLEECGPGIHRALND